MTDPAGGTQTTQTTTSSSGTETPFDFGQAISGLDKPLQDYVVKNGYKDLAGLVRSEMETRQMLGADRATLLSIPKASRADDPQAWAQVDQVMGVPKDGKYPEWKPAEGQLGASPEQLSKLDAALHKVAATPAQRNAALQAYSELATEAKAAIEEAKAQEKQTHAQALQREWGMLSNVKTAAALGMFESAPGGREAKALLEREGLADHPIILKMMQGYAEAVAEDGALDQGDPQKGGKSTMTKAEAEAEKSRLQNDQAFIARYNSGDMQAVNQMLKLNEIIASGGATTLT